VDGLDIATDVLDEAGESAVTGAAAKGVPWAIVVVIVKQILVIVAGALGGDRAKCLADQLTKPITAAKLTSAAVVDIKRLAVPDQPAGTSIWWAIRHKVKVCGVQGLDLIVVEQGVFNLCAGLAFTSAAQHACKEKVWLLQQKINAIEKEKLDAKLHVVQIRARMNRAERLARAKDRAAYRALPGSGGGGGGGLALGALAIGALILAAKGWG